MPGQLEPRLQRPQLWRLLVARYDIPWFGHFQSLDVDLDSSRPLRVRDLPLSAAATDSRTFLPSKSERHCISSGLPFSL